MSDVAWHSSRVTYEARSLVVVLGGWWPAGEPTAPRDPPAAPSAARPAMRTAWASGSAGSWLRWTGGALLLLALALPRGRSGRRAGEEDRTREEAVPLRPGEPLDAIARRWAVGARRGGALRRVA